MDDFRDKAFGDFGWKSMEQFFNGKFPFIQNGKAANMQNVDEFVQAILQQVMPNMNNSTSRQYHSEVFETHQSVVVKLNVPDKAVVKNAKLQVNPNLIRLSGLPGNEQQLIRLPHQVVPESCKAVYRESTLQLNLRKLKTSEKYCDVDIRFIE